MEAEVGVMLPQPRKAWSHQKMDEARKDSSLEHGRECGPAGALISDLWPPEF